MTDDDGRNRTRALYAAAAVVALVLAASMVPALDQSPLQQDSPREGTTEVPGGERTATRTPPSDGGGSGGRSGGPGGSGTASPGALNPGPSTGVGGAIESGFAPSNASTVHFEVDARRPSYWRTGAYGVYTGSGWERQSDPSMYTGGLPPGEGPKLVQTVTLRQPATSLPAAWQPARVDFAEGAPQVYVTDRNAFTVPDGVPANSTYTVTSYLNQPGPDDLRAVGTDYPDGVEVYTQLPHGTAPRLEQFTDKITANASGPYETARTIELWLEANKNYALNVSHDTSEPVAEQFVFEMDAGYCEYFATAMTVMLRTQGVPARYVVGYGPGTAEGGNLTDPNFLVRSVDAHAWVEVYFPEEGWVRFDPTPAASRRTTERRIIGGWGGPGQERPGGEAPGGESPGGDGPGDVRPVLPGSPGDGPGDDGIGEIPGVEGNQSLPDPAAVPRPPYDVSLNATPVPGAQVTVLVTKNGLPVEGATVTLNGVAAGRTNRNGEIVVTVPYSDRLVVNATREVQRDPDNEGPGSAASVQSTGLDRSDPLAAAVTVVEGTAASVPTLSDLDAGFSRPVADGPRPQVVAEAPDENDTERTYDLPTGVTIEPEGAVAPGERVPVLATINGSPLRGVDVVVRGATVGTTDRNGRATIRVPADATGVIDVRLERGTWSGSGDLPVDDLAIAVDPDALVALPGQGATVRVTAGGDPVSGATVTLDGEAIGTTDEDGSLDTTLPVANSARLAASKGSLSSTHTVSWLFARAGLVVAPLVLVLGWAVVRLRRRGIASDAEGLRERVAVLLARVRSVAVGAARRARRLAVEVVISLGAALSRLGDSLAALYRRALSGGWGLLGSLRRRIAGRSIRSLVAGGFAAVAVLARRAGVGLVGFVVAAVRRVYAGTRHVVLAILPWTDVSLFPAADEAGDGTGVGAGSTDVLGGETDGEASLPTVRELFRRFVRLVRVRGWRTKTPGEIARAATDRGFPESPVETLTDAFRDVEYGGREDDEPLRRRALAALESIEGTGDDGSSDENGPAASGDSGGDD